MGLSVGGAQPNISQRIVRAFPIPLAPFPEQKRIVNAIETYFSQLDAGVAALKSLQAKLRRYRAAVLKAACEGTLLPPEEVQAIRESPDYEPADRLLQRLLTERRKRWEEGQFAKGKNPAKLRYKEPQPPDTENLPPLPAGWVWATLNQLSWDAGYGTSQKCGYEASGPPVLRIPNIVQGRIDLGDLKYATKADELRISRMVLPGDLLIVRTNGSRDLIGRSALARSSLSRPHFFASYLIRFRITDPPRLAAWLASVWDAPNIRAELTNLASTTAGQYNLNITRLNTVPVPLPPREEQSQIIAQVERLLSLVHAVSFAQ